MVPSVSRLLPKTYITAFMHHSSCTLHDSILRLLLLAGDLALALMAVASVGGGVASYIPGTEANRISRAEQDSSTGSNTTAGLASYIPGTQANQESKAAAGQNSSTHTSGSDSAGVGLLGGLMSYIPGTEANRESRAATEQESTTHDSSSTSAQGGGVSYSDQQVSSARGGETDS